MAIPSPPVLHPLHAGLQTVSEARSQLGLEAVPRGVWVHRIGEAPEFLPTVPPALDVRCSYCRCLILSSTAVRCPSCAAPR